MAGRKLSGPLRRAARGGRRFLCGLCALLCRFWLLWRTSVSVSISAVSGRGGYWQAPGARRPSSENPNWPGPAFLCVPILPPGGLGVPGSAALRIGSACGPRPRPPAPICELPPRPRFPVPLDGFCCGRRTTPRFWLPGRLSLQGREASLPPVWPALCPACPGRYAAFPRPGLPFPEPSGTFRF